MKIKKIIFFIIVKLFIFTSFSFAQGNLNAKWYLVYQEQNGNLKKSIGPFNNKIQCESVKYNLPYGAKFLGCYQ